MKQILVQFFNKEKEKKEGGKKKEEREREEEEGTHIYYKNKAGRQQHTNKNFKKEAVVKGLN